MLSNILVLKITFIGASLGIHHKLDFEIDVVVVDSNDANDEKKTYSLFHQVNPCEGDWVMGNQR